MYGRALTERSNLTHFPTQNVQKLRNKETQGHKEVDNKETF